MVLLTRAATGCSAALAMLIATRLPATAPPAEAAQPRVVVPAIRAAGDVGEGTTDVVTELLLEALLNRHGLKALGPSDVRAMLSAEEQKALLGCEQDSCMAELAGAMGADRLIAGSVGKLGALYVVTLKLIDADKATVVARASIRVDKVEALVDAVGPLTDQLLGQQPRPAAARPPPALAPPPIKVEVLEPTPFCERAEAHAKALRDRPYSGAAVDERRALLSDLLHTPFLQQFDRKRSCIWEWDGRVGSSLRRAWLGADRPKDALDAQQRLSEWNELTRQLKLLEEAYTTGLEKEKHGAGQRPTALPFEVKPVAAWQPGDAPEVLRFFRAFKQAQRTVGQAIDAARRGQQQKFERLYTEPDPKRSRTSPHYVYEQLRSSLDNGYQLDPCPPFALTRSEVKYRAERLEREGILVGCLRKQKEDFASTDNIYLTKTPRGWRIDRW